MLTNTIIGIYSYRYMKIPWKVDHRTIIFIELGERRLDLCITVFLKVLLFCLLVSFLHYISPEESFKIFIFLMSHPIKFELHKILYICLCNVAFWSARSAALSTVFIPSNPIFAHLRWYFLCLECIVYNIISSRWIYYIFCSISFPLRNLCIQIKKCFKF